MLKGGIGLTGWKILVLVSWTILLVIVGSACGGTPGAGLQQAGGVAAWEPVSLGAGEKLKVVVTTNIVGDVVKNVGGDQIDLITLMNIGVDPHSYVATPADTAAIHDAHVVFANGAGLEANLEEMFASAEGDAARVDLSDGLELRRVAEEQQAEHDHEERGHQEADPHVWFNVRNVIHWVATIEEALSTLDPGNAATYKANAQAYSRQLEELDTWVMAQVAAIPEANRKLVSNHPSFGYFAERYGLEQVGAIYPVSPSSEPSAQDIAALEDAILHYNVPAVFAELTVNPKLAEQVAQDTGVDLVPLYSGSLGAPGSGVETYILLIRYDTKAIVEALKGS
jgi:ABC-type Zn uptake system ZnuABC Zn-binding protein ZnuA